MNQFGPFRWLRNTTSGTVARNGYAPRGTVSKWCRAGPMTGAIFFKTTGRQDDGTTRRQEIPRCPLERRGRFLVSPSARRLVVLSRSAKVKPARPDGRLLATARVLSGLGADARRGSDMAVHERLASKTRSGNLRDSVCAPRLFQLSRNEPDKRNSNDPRPSFRRHRQRHSRTTSTRL